MDLNQLYFDHQLLLMRAASSPASDAATHLCQAARIAGQIGDVQRAKGANAQAYWAQQAARACRTPVSPREVTA